MKNQLTLTAIILGLLALFLANAARAEIRPYAGKKTKANPAYHEYYQAAGKAVNDAEAFTAAIAGKDVYRCVRQEVSMGKTGRSASLKSIPKNN